MDFYKEYIYKITELSLIEPYIMIKDDVVPKLKEYILLLENIQLKDGLYHTYYGEIKNVLHSFTNYWTEMMDDVIREADKLTNFVTMDDLLRMLEETLTIHKKTQNDFENEFSPVETPLDKDMFNQIQIKYSSFLKNQQVLKEKIKLLDKQIKVETFAKEHFKISVKRKNDMFELTHNFISKQLSDYINRIHISLEEIVGHFQNNLRSMQETSEVNISRLLIRLYEKNKEHLMLSRDDIRSSVEIAEVQRSLDILKDKIEDSKHVPMNRLQDECKYWIMKMHEFKLIEDTIKKLESEERGLLQQEKDYFELKNEQIPAPKKHCWENMADTILQKKEELNDLKLNAAKALFTFFGVTGVDRIYYHDSIGKYFVDDLGHQCYVFDYGLKVYHVMRDGTLIDKSEKDKYFYDNYGRFIIGDCNEKLYQIAPCSSTYAIENSMFVRRTRVRDAVGDECCKEIRDCDEKIILPDVKDVNIKGQLSEEDAKYLWDTFGHILPEVLQEVAMEQPKNPIHILAHKLLLYKYNPKNDMIKKKKEAVEYREKIHQDRLNKIEALHQAWKDKQVKRRKPEESDDAEDKFAYNSFTTQQHFTQNVENYYN